MITTTGIGVTNPNDVRKQERCSIATIIKIVAINLFFCAIFTIDCVKLVTFINGRFAT